jgi:hypothetical protein
LDIYRIHKAEEKLNDQIRIIKGRKKKIEFGSNVQLYAWISGISNGARGSLGEDQIKYNKLGYSPFSAKNYRYYNYDYVETIHEDDRDLVVIHILPKKKSRKAIFETKVFIDEESLAIVRCDYKATETGVRLTERKDKGIAYGIMSKVVGATLDYHRFEASVTYKQYNHKWYLSTVNRGWEILVNSKKRNMVNVPWTSNMQLMITDINTENVKPITVGKKHFGNIIIHSSRYYQIRSRIRAGKFRLIQHGVNKHWPRIVRMVLHAPTRCAVNSRPLEHATMLRSIISTSLSI